MFRTAFLWLALSSVAACSASSSTTGVDGDDAGGTGKHDAAATSGATGGQAGSSTHSVDAIAMDAPGLGGIAGVGGTSGTGGRTSMDAPAADRPGAGGRGLGGRSAGGASGTGGRTSGGTGGAGGTVAAGAGGKTSGGSAGAGGGAGTGRGGHATGGGAMGTGGHASGGAGGTGTGGPKILWTDGIQSNVAPWGLDGYGTEHPIGTSVTASDANGANFSVVPDPLGGSSLAIRHFATFDTGGSRSQGGLYGDVNTIFGKQAKTAEGVWVAQEWYFPEAIGANGDAYCWINLWDFHSIDANRGNRWHTSPGLMLAQDGSMKVILTWGGPAADINRESTRSTVAMPVGRWFDVEMHYVWADTPTATITLWIDGQFAVQQSGVQTRASSHQVVETYLKFYGSTQGRGPWSPTPSLKYTRNVRVAGERIWR